MRPQFRDEPQYLLEHLLGDSDLGHLDGDVATVADDRGADLINFFRRLVSARSLIGSGVASVRRKLPRL